ncbi:hypothetical protein JIN77_11410 [Verrucomicrobiaceae bacterium R5-34]|nr:hypothetical protein [Verrucomicrobiaceae bacterium R5-34]
MNDESSNEVGKHIEQHLEYFVDRMNLLFSYHLCILTLRDEDEFFADPSLNGRSWAFSTIRKACLNSTLIAIRDIEDFLSPRIISPKKKRTREDDLRASDFGFDRELNFLSKDERDSINKLVAHTTQLGAMNWQFRWDIIELVSKAFSQCSVFLEWAKTEFSNMDSDAWMLAMVAQSQSEKILKLIHSEAERELKK